MGTHALVIGGTGMLRDATLWLASEHDVVSTIARSRSRSTALADRAAAEGNRIHPLSIDYRDDDTLSDAIGEAIDLFGPISLVLSWIHSTAPHAPAVVARRIDRQEIDVRWFDLLGSASADPSCDVDASATRFAQWPRIRYRSIILGFVVDAHGSRWLIDREISDGTIAAIRDDAPASIIGQVRPWSAHP